MVNVTEWHLDTVYSLQSPESRELYPSVREKVITAMYLILVGGMGHQNPAAPFPESHRLEVRDGCLS